MCSIRAHFLNWCLTGCHSNNTHRSDDYFQLYFSTLDAESPPPPLKKALWASFHFYELKPSQNVKQLEGNALLVLKQKKAKCYFIFDTERKLCFSELKLIVIHL